VNSEGLEKLERIARNLPVPRIDMGRVETNDGTIYMAWGRNSEKWHAVWGADIQGGSAQPLEIKLELNDRQITEDDVKQILLNTASLALGVYRGRNPITA
jgi:hypothetical protein